MSRPIRDELHMRAYRRLNGHLLTPAVKEVRQTRTEPRMDTKTSSSWARKPSPLRSSTSTRMTRFMLKHPLRRRRRFQGCREAITLAMSWFGGGCPFRGMTPLYFCEKGVKTGARVYQEDALQGVVKPCNSALFNGQKWVFQLLPTRPRRLRSGCGGTFRRFLAPRIGLWGVQTLTPLDYKLWAVLEDMSCRNWHNNLDSLKRSLVKAAAEISLETVPAAVTEWPEVLKACVEAEDGHFE